MFFISYFLGWNNTVLTILHSVLNMENMCSEQNMLNKDVYWFFPMQKMSIIKEKLLLAYAIIAYLP